MSGSNRSDDTKAGLKYGIIVATIFAAVFIWWGLSESAKYDREASYQTGAYAKYTDDKVAETCVQLTPVEKSKCRGDALETQRKNEREEEDLVAQRRSALWANIMGAVAVIGMGLSVIGVMLVRSTFRETKLANEIASSALRPWLSIRDIRVKTFAVPIYMHPVTHEHNPKEQWFQVNHLIEIIVENTGSKPALQLSCFTAMLEGYFPSSVHENWFQTCRNGGRAFLLKIAPNSIETIKSSAHYHTTIMKGAEFGMLGVSLIYNAEAQTPPFETSRLYDVAEIVTAKMSQGFSMEDLISAGDVDRVHGDGALPCELVSRFTGRMV